MAATRRGMIGAALALPALRSRAQGWPSRPIRCVVPSVTGGFDLYARIIGQRLAERLGQPVVIDNRPGANGNLGMAEVARAAPDGHTILFAAVGSLSINISVFRTMPFDPIDEFLPVALSVTSPMVWVANPAASFATLGELVTQARAAPGRIPYALPSSGTINHLIVEGFKLRHGLDIPAVPYRGTPPAQTDVIAGQVPFMVDSVGAGSGHIAAGRLRALAVTTRERSARLPDVPTAIELGLEDRDYLAWYAFMAPRGVPGEVVERLNAEINAIVAEPAVSARIQAMGADGRAMTPAAQGAFMRAEREKWGAIARAAGVEAV